MAPNQRSQETQHTLKISKNTRVSKETANTCNEARPFSGQWINLLSIITYKFFLSGEEKCYTAISRKVVGKNVHATTPKGNMGYDQYTVSNDCSCRTYFCCFLLALANLCPWPLVPFFQISLENRADKTTHNTFRDCRVRFLRQPLSKQLYTILRAREGNYLTLLSRSVSSDNRAPV